MKHPLDTPLDAHLILRKKKALRRELAAREGLLEKRIAILGGSTTADVRDMLELFLLHGGIRPVFHESEYGRFETDILYGDAALEAFRPDVVYLHTSYVNISRLPGAADSPGDVGQLLAAELARFVGLWDALERGHGCLVLQNSFDPPPLRLLGNQDLVDHRGRTNFVNRLNLGLAEAAQGRKGVLLHDLNYLAATLGLERWFDPAFWHSYKYALSAEALPHLGHSLAALLLAAFGLRRKCLVLDLDNTLWGGVVGDDGVEGLALGHETARGEAYLAFQAWVKDLAARGVLLAVCSKNDEDNARAGLLHPDSLLSPSDFAAIAANWEPKHENIRALAKALNIGLDSLVFADDNPAERALVAAQLPEVAVPELGDDVSCYPRLLQSTGLFESVGLSDDDLKRGRFYADNAAREQHAARFADYGAYLDSLDMTAEIGPFQPVHLERIAQLTNKTNQFNLTTLRCSLAEIQAAAADPDMLCLAGRLTDRFGDNGLVSVVMGRVDGQGLDILLWLMSCRVLKRGMEDAMFDAVAAWAKARGLAEIRGEYLKTPKNGMVAEHYARLGFERTALAENGDSRWRLALAGDLPNKNLHIRILP